MRWRLLLAGTIIAGLAIGAGYAAVIAIVHHWTTVGNF